MEEAATRAGVESIDGVEVVPLPQFPDERGAVYRMIRATDPHFRGFGEVYFSIVYPDVVKAWKRHRIATVNFACPVGSVTVALYDDRPGSPTRGAVGDIVLAPDRYSLLVIPAGVWHGFKGMSEPMALLVNCATEVFDSEEFERIPPFAPAIPYVWR